MEDMAETTLNDTCGRYDGGNQSGQHTVFRTELTVDAKKTLVQMNMNTNEHALDYTMLQ
jgi:hypothetical protein